MANTHYLKAPLSQEDVKKLKSGDVVYISGVIYSARDAAHKRLVDLIEAGQELPFDLNGAIIYYVGPTPPKPGEPIGSAGPTTSYRMDSYSPTMMKHGLRGMIGKGKRNEATRDAMREFGGVYFGATGGAGALLSRAIKKAEVIAYEELGPEAVRRLEVENFPAIVINDCYGNDLYEEGRSNYEVK